jgi:hypothetical protein
LKEVLLHCADCVIVFFEGVPQNEATYLGQVPYGAR